MKNKIKKIIPLILCFVMILGSCLTVNAARISSDKGTVGDTFSFGIDIFVPYNNYYRSYLVSASITDASDEVRVTPMLYISDNDYFASSLLFCSKKPFSINYQVGNIFDSKNETSYTEIVLDNTFSADSKSLIYNGETYYYYNAGSSSIMSGSADIEVLNVSASPIDPLFYDPNYDRKNFGLLLEKLYLADFVWDDGQPDHGGSGGSFDEKTEPDINSGVFDSKLGYLSNITYSNYIRQNSDGYPIDSKYTVGWSNNHSEWDSSYKVAHYVKVRADIRSVGSETKSLYSDMIFVDDVLFSDCKSSFTNSYLVANPKYRDFIENVEEQTGVLSNYITGYTHYLIIYQETDNGIRYGYWNQVRSDDFESGSIGKVPGYGIIDSDGNFVIIEEGDRLNDYEIGVGDSIEDAENNAEIVTPNFDALPSIETIGDFMEYFQEMMASLFETIGSLPKYIAEFFSFLPGQIITCLSLGLLIAIILRILGR